MSIVCLLTSLLEISKHIYFSGLKEVLRSVDHAGDELISNSLTYASVIYVLSENPKFIIAPGKPHEKEYIELKFY